MHLYDNGDIEFKHRELIGIANCDVQPVTNKPISSWIDYYQTLYPFEGYGGLPADMIQITYDRHFFLELHDLVPDDLKPPNDDAMNTPFISAIADARALEITKTSKPKQSYEKITWALIGCLFCEIMMWIILYAT